MPYAPDAMLFDGSTDNMLRTSALTGLVDGKLGTISTWLQTSTDGGQRILTCRDLATSGGIQFQSFTSGRLQLVLRDSIDTTLVLARTNRFIFDGLWHHILYSWDLNGPTVNVYLDDVEDKETGGTEIDGVVSYDDTDWAVGDAPINLNQKWTGAFSDMYFAPEFLDLTVESNRRKFIDADGIAVYLGDTGELPTGTGAKIYLRGIQTNQALNSGSGGDFVSSATQVPGETTGPTDPDPGNASVPYLPKGILFDGTTDFMLRGAELTGIVDGKTGTASAWLRRDDAGGAPGLILSNTNIVPQAQIFFRWEADNRIIFVGRKLPLLDILNLRTSVGQPLGTYIHVIISWDLTNVARRHVFVDDVDDINVQTFTNDVIAYSSTVTDWTVGAQGTAGTAKFNGAISDLWFSTEYIDLSVQANRRKFIDSSLNPVFLGDDGTLPTGDFPEVYLPGDKLDQGFNGGSGGDFVSQGTQVPGETPGPRDPGALPGGPGDDMRHLARRTGRFHRFFRG